MDKINSLKDIHSIHFTGIKGVGMTALACCAQDLGIKISGSDIEETFVTDITLKERKIKWHIGFDPQNINHPNLLITTGAHGGLKNPEVITAQEKGVPVLTHGQALGLFMKGKVGISICGVGGKTTTSAMLATILHYNKLHPSYAIGAGEIFPLKSPGKYDSQGKLFIAEADEYATSPDTDNRPRFFWQNPQYIIATNIEYDHPDVYKNIEETKKAFLSFFKKIPPHGQIIINGDNTNNLWAAKKSNRNFSTFGFGKNNEWQIKNIHLNDHQQTFNLYHKNKVMGKFTLNVPGQFNIKNAAGAIILSFKLGLSPKKISNALKKFKGVRRRFEFIGKKNGVLVYDDYAHHPQEIRSTLIAAKEWFGEKKRITIIFQSHTFSRTQKLLSSFALSFKDAYRVIIIPIYSSAREKGSLSWAGKKLSQAIMLHHPRVTFLSSPQKVVQNIKSFVRKDDIIMTMGAGDVWKINQKILKIL